MRAIETDMQPKVARCRLVISLIALVAIYLDPTEPANDPSLDFGRGAIDLYAATALGGHLLYSVAVLLALRSRPVRPWLTSITTWSDVVFGAVIMAFTGGTSSPFWAFFVFAVIGAGTNGGFRRSIAVTTVSVAVYLSLILVAWQGDTNFYVVRPVYLAVVGYLVAYLGQQRVSLEAEVHRLETGRQRSRIARALHDGCVQTLGGINLTLETARHLVRAGRTGDALDSLARLQSSINREHDELRAYVRALADVEPTPIARTSETETRFAIRAEFGGPAAFVEQVLGLVREAITNVRRHARARSASITIGTAEGELLIAVDDDGVGFAAAADAPWSLSATVVDAGGRLRIVRDGPGAHLRLALPES